MMEMDGQKHREEGRKVRMDRQQPRMDREKLREALQRKTPVMENGFRHFSVLIPLIVREDGIHVLYEVRARGLDRQPGEICFPGGEVEKGEDWKTCALRETFEEIGIPQESIEILDELTTIYGSGKFAMHVYPGILDAEAERQLDPSEAEVAEVFTVPLEHLLQTEPELYYSRMTQEGPEDFPYDRVTGGAPYPWSRASSLVPVYDVDGWIIWGLTGRATKVLLEQIESVQDAL